MKNRKRSCIIALVLMLTMIISSEALAFAAEGTVDQTDNDAAVQTETVAENDGQQDPEAESQDAVDPETEGQDQDGTVDEDSDDLTGDTAEEGQDEELADDEENEDVFGDDVEVIGEEPVSEGAAEAEAAADAEDKTAVPDIKALKAYPGFESITLRWNRVEGAKYYLVKRSTKSNKGFKTVIKFKEKKHIYEGNTKKISYRDKKSIKKNKKYYYRIYAIKVVDGKEYKSKAATVSEKAVRPMYEEITFNQTRVLTSHDSAQKTRTFPVNTTVTAEGFGGGRFQFYYKGNYYNVAYTSVKNAKADYLKKKNYNSVTAVNFVNESGKASKTKYLIWVSTYTQHIFVFKGKKGNWKLLRSWECSTGKAASPSPSGFDLRIHTKTYSYSNNIPWWMMYSSYNSIHGKKPEYEIGVPASHGCVRNYNENAKWMYDRMAVGTGLIVN
jgi:lipoprotein-anchoring transpeptidase ErfK/SrfK